VKWPFHGGIGFPSLSILLASTRNDLSKIYSHAQNNIIRSSIYGIDCGKYGRAYIKKDSLISPSIYIHTLSDGYWIIRLILGLLLMI